MNDVANNVLFSSAIDGNMAGNLSSDWLKLDRDVKTIAIEALWRGNPTGTFTLQQKIDGSKTRAATATVSNNPDGTVYSGNLDAANLDAESLGSALITADILTDRVRLVYTRSGGTGTLRGKFVVKKI